MTGRRTRRTADDARALILDAAASLLAESGVAAVQVRSVAKRVGMTDAGVNHHFGTRDQLLEALLRHGGRQLRQSLDEVLTSWVTAGADVAALVESLASLYRSGYAELALALHAAGWRDESSGLLDPVVDALHQRRPSSSRARKDDTRLAVAALHQSIALESAYGPAFRRSAGFSASRADDPAGQHRWWARTIERLLTEG